MQILLINTVLHSNLNSSTAIGLNIPIHVLHLPEEKKYSKSLKLLWISEARAPSLPSLQWRKSYILFAPCCKLTETCLKASCSGKNRFKKVFSHLCVTKRKQPQPGLHTCLKGDARLGWDGQPLDRSMSDNPNAHTVQPLTLLSEQKPLVSPTLLTPWLGATAACNSHGAAWASWPQREESCTPTVPITAWNTKALLNRHLVAK